MLDFRKFYKELKSRGIVKTQLDVAEKVGVTRAQIAHYSTGRNKPSLAVMMHLEREFGANPKWLKTGKGKMFLETGK